MQLIALFIDFVSCPIMSILFHLQKFILSVKSCHERESLAGQFLESTGAGAVPRPYKHG